MPTPSLLPIPSTLYTLGGAVGQRIKAVTDNWLLVAPLANPAMLEMFAERDNPPYRNLMPWAGEFAGKYLTSAVQVLQVTNDERLKAWLTEFVARLVGAQAADGYLGPWPADSRLANTSHHHGASGMGTWDTWGHYHNMLGLLLWHEHTGDASALQCACRIADLICEKYLGPKPVRLVNTGMTEMNLAPVHSLARLYRVTGTPRYLEMALQIVEEFAARDANGPLAGNFLNHALAGLALYQMPRPRWESLHSILGLIELYWITGDERYRQAFERIWWGNLEFDRHNNGGFTSGEQTTGNPYDQGAIETCCTIAWLAMSVEMLLLSGNSIVADELELTTLNSVLGMHSPSGRWSTYNTPMDGARFGSAHAIVFQSRSGSPELNCCSVNSPRGLGLIGRWALLDDAGGLVLNYYGPSSIRTTLASGLAVELNQETTYPVEGRIRLTIIPQRPAEFTLKLRIPYWSAATRLALNGQPMEAVRPGRYYPIRREWQPGDVIEIELDLSLHFWSGERQCQDLLSVYRGPVLLAYDQRYNRQFAGLQQELALPDDCFKVTRDLLAVPRLDPANLTSRLAAWDGWLPPTILVETRTESGEPVHLCDFASAGATGTLYRSWLPASHAPAPVPFSPENPLRSRHN